MIYYTGFQCNAGVSLTSQHSLDRLLGQALGILELLDSHGACELDISIDDGRADIAGAIALDPAVLCEVEAIQLHSEKFHPTAPDQSTLFPLKSLACTVL